jgi:hypothetical protein
MSYRLASHEKMAGKHSLLVISEINWLGALPVRKRWLSESLYLLDTVYRRLATALVHMYGLPAAILLRET